MNTLIQLDTRAAAQAYADAFEALTESNIDGLCALCAETVRFKDPFNDVRGKAALSRIFEHMFETLNKPKFIVEDITTVETRAYLKWRFTFKPKARSKGEAAVWEITGMSGVSFNSDGLVTEHVDYWDAAEQFYEKLPVIGSMLRLVRRKLSV